MKNEVSTYVEAGVSGVALTNVSSMRDVRSAYLQAASWISEHQGQKYVIALKNPQLSESSLVNFESEVRHLFKPEISYHIHMVIDRHSKPDSGMAWSSANPKELARWYDMILSAVADDTKASRPRGFAQHTVTMLLIRDWLLGRDARSMLDLQQTTGLSYPTVREVVESLEPWITRGTYKRIQLSEFPSERWKRLVLESERVRETIYYHDPYGLARSTKALLSRLNTVPAPVSVGGVIGAHHYYSDLDLIGSPRLDLTLHQEGGDVDTSWMKEVDAALEPIDAKKSSLRPPQAKVAIHVLRRKETFFEVSSHGFRVADPAECLLDLVDLRLTDQAQAFANHFSRKITIDA